MSASNKKQLRKENKAVKMTERQLAAQKEEKQVKLYTTIFVVVMVVMLIIAICVGVSSTINNSGIREKNTVAATIGNHKLNNTQLNYYYIDAINNYIDAINNFASQYGSYASLVGLDTTKALDEQYVDAEQTTTWADNFLSTATSNAASVYALADAAEAAGHALSETEYKNLDATLGNLEAYATIYGYESGEAYLKAMYGRGADLESYREYYEINTLAQSYYETYADSLTYTEEDLRAADAEDPNAYSSYTYNTYYLSASKFLTGGTTDEEGNTTYTDEEKAASVTAAEEAAKALTAAEIASVADLDAAIAALSVNEGSEASSTAYTDAAFSSVSSTYADWLTDSSRKAGDLAYFENATTSTNEDGTETTAVNGYYVVRFESINDNSFALANVRHILIAPEHQHEEGETHAEGETYSEEEMAAAKAQAEEILAQWEAGDATEDSFAALANEKSADGDGTTGGLYENVYPGQMVANFNDWCFDETRTSGDTGIVESTYGYHVMYYVGDSETNYRDYQIENELRSSALESWHAALVDAMTVTDGDTSYIPKDLVLGSN